MRFRFRSSPYLDTEIDVRVRPDRDAQLRSNEVSISLSLGSETCCPPGVQRVLVKCHERQIVAPKIRARPGLAAAIASLVVASLITIASIVVVFSMPLSSSNRDVAVGDSFGGGIFLLAVVAAVVAVLAYAESSRRPKLKTRWGFWSAPGSFIWGGLPTDTARRDFTDIRPASVRDQGDLVALAPVEFSLAVENDGEVAARNVAVLIRLEGIYFSPVPSLDSGGPWRIIPTPKGTNIQWEGGADRAVYPGEIPRTPSLKLTGLWADTQVTHTDWGEVITFADDLRHPERHPLQIDAALPPTPIETTTPATPE